MVFLLGPELLHTSLCTAHRAAPSRRISDTERSSQTKTGLQERSCKFSSNSFNPQWAESTDAEPVDMDVDVDMDVGVGVGVGGLTLLLTAGESQPLQEAEGVANGVGGTLILDLDTGV